MNLSAKQVEDVQPLDPRLHGQADMDEVVEVRDRCLSHPRVLERIRQYKLPGNFKVVCDTWPYGRDSGESIRRLSQVRIVEHRMITSAQCLLFAANVIADHLKSI